jgi:hypothetical protein
MRKDWKTSLLSDRVPLMVMALLLILMNSRRKFCRGHVNGEKRMENEAIIMKIKTGNSLPA